MLGKSFDLRFMALWVVDRGLQRFSDLDETGVRDLITWLMHRKGSRAGTSVGVKTLKEFVLLLSEMRYLFQIGEIGDGLVHDPVRIFTQIDLSSLGLARVKPRNTPRIPEKVARHLLVKSIDWMERIAPLYEKLAKDHHSADGILLGELTGIEVNFDSGLRRVRRHLMTACIIVYLAFTGFRISEVLSAEVPNDASRPDDSNEAFSTTRVFKTSDRGVGTIETRPVPSIVVKAVEIASRIGTEDRGELANLFVVPGLKVGSVAVSGRGWGRRIDGFARHVGVPATANGFELEEWHFSAHQFRRFFALFYVRRYEGPSDPISDHFAHVNDEMVLSYTNDPDTAKFMIEEKIEFTSQVMHEIATGELLAVGPFSVYLRQLGATYRAKAMTPQQIDQEIRARLAEDGLELVSSGYSLCTRSSTLAFQALCGVDADGLPNAIGRTIDACLVCANGCFTVNHIPALRAEYLVNMEIVSAFPSGPFHEIARQRANSLKKKIRELEQVT